jgi:hypothetical protein
MHPVVLVRLIDVRTIASLRCALATSAMQHASDRDREVHYDGCRHLGKIAISYTVFHLHECGTICLNNSSVRSSPSPHPYVSVVVAYSFPAPTMVMGFCGTPALSTSTCSTASNTSIPRTISPNYRTKRQHEKGRESDGAYGAQVRDAARPLCRCQLTTQCLPSHLGVGARVIKN